MFDRILSKSLEIGLMYSLLVLNRFLFIPYFANYL